MRADSIPLHTMNTTRDQQLLLTKRQINDLTKSSLFKIYQNEVEFKSFIKHELDRPGIEPYPKKFLGSLHTNFESFCEKNRVLRNSLLVNINLRATEAYNNQSEDFDNLCRTFIEQIQSVDINSIIESVVLKSITNSKLLNTVNANSSKMKDVYNKLATCEDGTLLLGDRLDHNLRVMGDVNKTIAKLKSDVEKMVGEKEITSNILHTLEQNNCVVWKEIENIKSNQ